MAVSNNFNGFNGDIRPARVGADRRRFTMGTRDAWPRVLLAGWGWIAAIALTVTAAAAVVAQLQPSIYRAQAVVAIYPAAPGSSALQPFVMGTEKGIASSGAVLSIASQSMPITQSRLQQGLSISVPVDSDLLVIAFSDPSPQLAQRAAQTIAQAYVAYRTDQSPAPSTSATRPPGGAIQAAVVSDAELPSSPVSPNRVLIVIAAAILGLALGIAITLLRDLVDDRLRGALDLQAQGDAPVLAQIPAFQAKGGTMADRLVSVRHPTSPAADAYRNLRTRILQMGAWRRANLLLVTSPNREDKGSVAANLAAALGLSGRRVILVCADLRDGCTHAFFGIQQGPGLSNLVYGETSLPNALQWPGIPGVQVLPAGSSSADSSSVLQSGAFARVLGDLRGAADFVVVDAPAVLPSADMPALAEHGGMILLVADARLTSRAEVRAAMHELAAMRENLIGCVLENVGRPQRLPTPSIGAAMRTLNQDATAQGGVTSDHAAAHADVENQPMTLIHGEENR